MKEAAKIAAKNLLQCGHKCFHSKAMLLLSKFLYGCHTQHQTSLQIFKLSAVYNCFIRSRGKSGFECVKPMDFGEDPTSSTLQNGVTESQTKNCTK